ncbi:unnamed protein product [Gongylonema pulchrum]|uniref:Uncharacterized protein n=1 Tax=Gongylonema pulchrum TaxID=637853 RepID=A0A3P7RS53_9BILA|nr:unnamed protein product [Gongylonema pulchrum]
MVFFALYAINVIYVGFAISVFLDSASGIHWSQLFVHPSPDEPLTLGHFFVMLIVDAAIFGIITWYIEALNPGFDGVPQKPYFFLQVL